MSQDKFDRIRKLCEDDIATLESKGASYGNSWQKRGGVGAFMMLCRKWDRIETALAEDKFNSDIFKAIEADTREEGILDDIRDLRRYFFLVDEEMERRAEEAQKKLHPTHPNCPSVIIPAWPNIGPVVYENSIVSELDKLSTLEKEIARRLRECQDKIEEAMPDDDSRMK